jgi:hypothetical protein
LARGSARSTRWPAKWLARLLHPYTAADQAAGYAYDISILQSEFSLTQVFDLPLPGRFADPGYPGLIRSCRSMSRATVWPGATLAACPAVTVARRGWLPSLRTKTSAFAAAWLGWPDRAPLAGAPPSPVPLPAELSLPARCVQNAGWVTEEWT